MRIATPTEISQKLLDIAQRIERASSPSLSAVVASLQNVLASMDHVVTATDRSIAVAIRDALHSEIQKMVPGEVTELHDTNLDGKGFKPGFISFGMQPVSWQTEGIIGTLLIQGTYNASEFRSERKDDSGSDFQHSQGGAAITVSLTASYYNKKAGGGMDVQDVSADLGKATIMIGADESIEEIELDSTRVSTGIKHVMNEILSHPPDYAQSAKRKQKQVAPTSNPKGFVNWLLKNERSEVGKSEVDALVRSMMERGIAGGTAREQALDALRKAHIPVNPHA